MKSLDEMVEKGVRKLISKEKEMKTNYRRAWDEMPENYSRSMNEEKIEKWYRRWIEAMSK